MISPPDGVASFFPGAAGAVAASDVPVFISRLLAGVVPGGQWSWYVELPASSTHSRTVTAWDLGRHSVPNNRVMIVAVCFMVANPGS